ncbi:unnamed protein product [Ceratitis capitata]|uniref:(Mediterranean fruit fly) hypothetical protein n=1 Tax=Ceratitis capitata TaxID=7213 RepID=A0A811USV7_CERCA|nr:unnamed protein product [Ceratitis capitata]
MPTVHRRLLAVLLSSTSTFSISICVENLFLIVLRKPRSAVARRHLRAFSFAAAICTFPLLCVLCVYHIATHTLSVSLPLLVVASCSIRKVIFNVTHQRILFAFFTHTEKSLKAK